MAGLGREPPGRGGQHGAGTDCFVRAGDEADSNWEGGGGKFAVASTAEWSNTASVSEMQCMQGGHVG